VDGVLDLPTELDLQTVDDCSINAEQHIQRYLQSQGGGISELSPDLPREIFDLSVGEIPRSKIG
jgi:hypothetical protein